MNVRWLFGLALMTSLTGLSIAQEPQTVEPSGADGADARRAHYLVVEADRNGGLDVVHHQLVNLQSPLESLNDTEFASRAAIGDTRLDDVATVQVADSTGRVTFQTVVDIPRWLRGERYQPNYPQSGQVESVD